MSRRARQRRDKRQPWPDDTEHQPPIEAAF
jgi:DNA-directed RNA polymerase subunit K/omega